MPATENSVRAVEFGEVPTEQQLESSPISNYSDTVSPLEEVFIQPPDEYPYSKQRIRDGSFSYEASTFLGTASASVHFQLRHGSNLLIVQKESGSAKLQSIVSALDKFLDDEINKDISIHEQFFPTRSGLWKFINSAAWISSLTLRVQDEDISLDEYRERHDISFEDIVDNKRVVFADLVFESPWEEPVSVIYDHGKLEIATTNDDLYEFVLQRFETDILS